MTLSTLARLLTGVVLFILMARAWGAEGFGHFVYPFTIASLLVVFVEYGFSLQMVRDIGRRPSEVQTVVHRALGAKTLLSIAVFIIAGALTFVVPGQPQTRWLLSLLLGAAILNSFAMFLNVPFRGLGRFEEETKVVLTSSAVHFGLVATVVALGAGPTYAAVGFVVSRTLYLVLSVAAYRRVVGALDWRAIGGRAAPMVLSAGLPFGIFTALGTLYFQVDTLLVQHYLGAEAVGLYQAGIRVLMAALLLPEVLCNVYLPAVAGAGGEPAGTIRLGTQLTRLLLLGGIIGLAGLTAAPRAVTDLLFGSSYAPVAELLPGFGVVLLLRFVASGYGLLLTVGDRQGMRTITVGVTVLVSLGLNVLLIQRFGLRGALLASVLTHLFLLITYATISASSYRRSFVDGRSAVLAVVGVMLVWMAARPWPTSWVAVLALAIAALAIGVKWADAPRALQGAWPLRPGSGEL